MKILQFPIFRICFWFILGIIAAYYCPLNIKYVFGLLAISTVIFSYFQFQYYRKFEQKKGFSISLYILFFVIGITTTLVHNDTFRENHYTHNTTNFDSNHIIKVTVIEKLKNTSNNNRYIVQVTQIDDEITSGKIVLE